ncbi:MAG: DUF4434 domain-containing protein [Candidatus Krumholzibacteria bacterium]|nr:DUF4434 domain-containing protein [Candidatus Krumholzibacteria bacterium]
MISSAQCILISTLLLLAPAPAVGSAARPKLPTRPRIGGTFIQYQDWMMSLDSAAWLCELDAMRDAGINLVIIQWLEHENKRFIPADPAACDPARIILEYADEHGMRVYLGLSTIDRWHERITHPRYLDRAATQSLRLADQAWARYGRHPSFAGWYIPQELRYYEFKPEFVSLLRGFLRRQSDHCRAISGGKPVAIAPSLAQCPSPEAFRKLFADLLAGSGVEILILQDGVGANRREKLMDSNVVPYFRAMQDVCGEAEIEIWSDIEIFRYCPSGRGREPASVERILEQIDAEAPFVSSFVMFDFFHYMSPCRGEEQKRLFEDYLRATADSSGASH